MNNKAGKDKDSRQLGMLYQSAIKKLRGQLLYAMACGHIKLDNTCYRCDKPIEDISEFSIEHVKPWRNNDTGLFWDLNNISFSHIRYNALAASKRSAGKFPEGKSWCSGCKDFLDDILFNRNKSKPNGLSSQCRTCHKESVNNLKS